MSDLTFNPPNSLPGFTPHLRGSNVQTALFHVQLLAFNCHNSYQPSISRLGEARAAILAVRDVGGECTDVEVAATALHTKEQ